MLVWNKPQLGDREWISKCVEEAGYMGSDAAFASIYLLQSKYNIRVAFYKDCLIRYYEGHNSRHGYTFPLGAGNIDKALEAIKQDAIDNNRKLEFCFITEEQKAVLRVSLYTAGTMATVTIYTDSRSFQRLQEGLIIKRRTTCQSLRGHMKNCVTVK